MRRAIGIVRQSRGREESLSPTEQRERIAAVCEREGLELVAVHEEIDVSGGSALADREGLRAAVEAVEAGQAEVVVVAYFDRLFRSLVVQAEVVGRIEDAGGAILTADVGEVSGATPAQWISGTMLGVVSEYYRRSIKERSGAAQRIAVAEGRVVFPNAPPGYTIGENGTLTPDERAPVVAEAFELRAAGAPIAEVRAHLRAHGIERSYSSVTRLLASRVVLGEINFGELRNAAAHPPIVEPEVWAQVQRVRESRGIRPRSERLLARLGVLRCGNCGGRMVVGAQTSKGRRYPFYRCSPVGDCTRRQTIGAEIAEAFTVEQVKKALVGMEGRASAEQEARDAEVALAETQARLDSAIRAFGEFGEEAAATERLRELRDERDRARERVEHLGHLRSALTVSVEDWESFTLEGRRGLIRAVLEEVTVHPGRGVGRLSASLRV